MGAYSEYVTPTPAVEFIAGEPLGFKSITVMPDTTDDIMEGTVMAKKASDGIYYPYESGGSGGLGVPKCILAERIPSDSGATPTPIPANSLIAGRVKDSKVVCDGSAGSDSTTRAALTAVYFDLDE